jgi:hypothetical protein
MADDFSWAKPAEQYLALYNSILPPPKKAGDPCTICPQPEKLPAIEEAALEELLKEEIPAEELKEEPPETKKEK